MLVFLIIVILWVPKNSAVLEYVRYLIFACLSMWFILSSNFRGIRDLAKSLFFPFYFFLCLSALWADDFVFSLIRATLMSLTVFTAFSIVRMYSMRCIVSSICIGLASFALMGVLAALFFPSVGVEQTWLHHGKWNGLSSQKNVFALNVVLALIFLIVSREMFSSKRTKRRLVINSAICVLLFALLKSGARSGIMDLLIVLGVLSVIRINWRATRVLLPTILICGGLLALFLLLFVVEFEGKYIHIGNFVIDTSSRTTLWSFGFDAITQSELSILWGMGYGGFWTEIRLEEFQRNNGWVLPNFHNGYLSAYFELGLIGIFLLLVVLWQAGYLFVQNLRMFRTGDGGLIYLLVFIQFGIHNLYENNLMRSTDIALFLFCLSLAGLYLNISKPRHGRPLGPYSHGEGHSTP